MTAEVTADQSWLEQVQELVTGQRSFLILVHGATSLEPLAEELQPRRRHSEKTGTKRHWGWPTRRSRPNPSKHLTARYAVAGQPLLTLLLDAFIGDLDRLDHGRDPVGELRFESPKRRRDYLTDTADLAVPDPVATDRLQVFLPLFQRIVPKRSKESRIVLLAELEPGTMDIDDWKETREVVPSKLGDAVGIAVADPDKRFSEFETNIDRGLLFFDATTDPLFQRPKRGERPLRAGLGIEPTRSQPKLDTGGPKVSTERHRPRRQGSEEGHDAPTSGGDDNG